MKDIKFTQLAGDSKGYYALLAGFAVMIALGGFAVLQVEHAGHWITGMNNRIAWGMPHVFAIFLIIAASGALNVASISSVFGKTFYKPMARLSAILSVLLLIGGLAILVLDLGRPDRLIVAMTEYNFSSIFAWNIILYTGFIAIVAVYLWFMFERKMNQHSRKVSMVAFIWRVILTSGTGAIFGFLVARQAYDSVVFAPMFVVLSFSLGLAVFLLVLLAIYKGTSRELGDKVVSKLANLLGIFVAAVLSFVIVYHLGSAYMAKNVLLTNYILFDPHIHNTIFWYGQILLGSILPLLLIYCKKINKNTWALALAAILVIIGGLSLLYVVIIGGQELPLQLFPGKEILIGTQLLEQGYTPSIWEVLLGIGGIGLVFFMLTLALKILPFLPEKLPNELVDNR